jgi:hypothetical protein
MSRNPGFRMFARCSGDCSHEAAMARGLAAPSGAMWRFSAKRAYRYPVLRTSAVASTPHGTCETCRQSTTPRPLSAAARCSELEGERLRCPCWARAQFTRHLIARCCKTAEAVASVDPPQAPTGARSALRELPAPTAVLAMRPAAASAARTVTSGSLARAAVDEVITGAAWTRSRPESTLWGRRIPWSRDPAHIKTSG